MYVEVGVRFGRSLALAAPTTRCLGIDPEPCVEVPLSDATRVVQSTSDDFFDTTTVADTVGMPADLSFIDGMHLFDFSLRDFPPLQRDSRPGSVILFHDCHPKDVTWGERGVRSGSCIGSGVVGESDRPLFSSSGGGQQRAAQSRRPTKP